MRGLDTNVLVRYLTQDDPRQAEIATREIEQAHDRLLIQPVVLCELVWVLETSYGLARQEVVDTLDAILDTTQLEVAEKELVRRALADYRSGRADFSDYLVGWGNERANARPTLTFDRKLEGHAAFVVLR